MRRYVLATRSQLLDSHEGPDRIPAAALRFCPFLQNWIFKVTPELDLSKVLT